MTVSAAQQAEIFIYCFLCGIFVGVIFDVFRVTRRIIPTGTAVTFVEDLAFWLITLTAVFFCAVQSNHGDIRWYMLAAIAMGGAIYFFTVSRLIMYICVLIIETTKKILKFIVRILLIPVKFIVKIFKKPIFFVFNISKSGIKKLINKIHFNVFSFKKYYKQLKKKKNVV